jgi:ferredoxin-NADP reductase
MRNTLQKSYKHLSEYIEPVIGLIRPEFRWEGINAKVHGIRVETEDFFTVAIKPNSLSRFKFEPGQHISLKVEINGRAYERVFSISSSLNKLKIESLIELSIKRITGGKVTNWLADHLKPGMPVIISPAMGSFTLDRKIASSCNAFIACGSGITPILSILESLPETSLPTQFLLFSVSHIDSAPFIERLRLLAKNGLNLRILESSTEGRLNNVTLQTWLNNTQIENVYSCGPCGLPEHVKELFEARCQSLSTEPPQFHFESFGVRSTKPSDVHRITFTDGKGREINALQGEGTLLDNAEAQGLNPIYGCRAGICHQCITRKTNGRVRNLLTNEVSESGIQDIQLCICIAESDVELEINERTIQ